MSPDSEQREHLTDAQQPQDVSEENDGPPVQLTASRKRVNPFPMNLCVYCSSSDAIDARYREAAAAMGRHIGERGDTLVYGGGKVGLIGVTATAVHNAGGRVFGVIPKALRAVEGVAYEVADELVETQTMQERKALMFNLAHAFLVLPGGFGTLEEFLEVLTLKQLGYHDKAIVLLNADGFFDPLLQLFDHLYAERFARERYRTLYHIADTPEAVLAYLDTYEAEAKPTKRT